MSAIHETQAVANRAGDSDLRGRVAFVTGGTRGIGAAISRGLAARGAIVAAGYSRSHENAEAFRDELAAVTSDASIHQGNIGTADDCRRTVNEVIERHGRLDIVVNNAGVTADKTVMKMTASDWHTVLSVNLSGAFFCSQAALGHMLERGSGRIVNISSLAGQIGNIGQANYAASKSGLFGLWGNSFRHVSKSCAACLASWSSSEFSPISVRMSSHLPASCFASFCATALA